MHTDKHGFPEEKAFAFMVHDGLRRKLRCIRVHPCPSVVELPDFDQRLLTSSPTISVTFRDRPWSDRSAFRHELAPGPERFKLGDDPAPVTAVRVLELAEQWPGH